MILSAAKMVIAKELALATTYPIRTSRRITNFTFSLVLHADRGLVAFIVRARPAHARDKQHFFIRFGPASTLSTPATASFHF